MKTLYIIYYCKILFLFNFSVVCFVFIYLYTILLALTVFLLWNYGVLPGNQIGFFCNDPLFSHKYTGDTIPTVLLAVLVLLMVPFTYFTIEYNRQRRIKDTFGLQSLCEFFFYCKQLVIGFILVGGCTELGKFS